MASRAGDGDYVSELVEVPVARNWKLIAAISLLGIVIVVVGIAMALSTGKQAEAEEASTADEEDEAEAEAEAKTEDAGPRDRPATGPAVDCELSEWSDWSECSTRCGEGTQTRTMTITRQAENGGMECPSEDQLTDTRTCVSEENCVVDCELSDWTPVGQCSEPCGPGERFMRRTVLKRASNGGRSCAEVAADDNLPNAMWLSGMPVPTQEATVECNLGPCCDPMYAWLYPQDYTWVNIGNNMCVQEKRPFKVFYTPDPTKDGGKRLCPPEPPAERLDPRPCDAPGVHSEELCRQQLVAAAKAKNAQFNCTGGRYAPTCDTNDLEREAIVRLFATGAPSSEATPNCSRADVENFILYGGIPGSELKPPPPPSDEPGPDVATEPFCHKHLYDGKFGTERRDIIARSNPSRELQCLRDNLSPDACEDLMSCDGPFDREDVNMAFMEWARTAPEAYKNTTLGRVHPWDDRAWVKWSKSPRQIDLEAYAAYVKANRPDLDPCAFSDWGRWSSCSRPCGGGTHTRTRVVNSACEGVPSQETGPCNEQPCCQVSEWSEWSPCSRDCGGGEQRRTRTVVIQGPECPPLEETRACNTEPCDPDCKVSEWGPWSACSLDADDHCTYTRERTVTKEAQEGGKPCPPLKAAMRCWKSSSLSACKNTQLDINFCISTPRAQQTLSQQRTCDTLRTYGLLKPVDGCTTNECLGV